MVDPLWLLEIRPARAADGPAIEQLHGEFIRRLAVSYYSPAQLESVLAGGMLDRALVAAGTYYVAELGDRLVGSGGWMPVGRDPGGRWRARIRAIFVHPDWARRGIGRRLVAHAETAAAETGFGIFELEASLPGVPLYQSLGYREVARCGLAMPDGATLPDVRMEKARAMAQASSACG